MTGRKKKKLLSSTYESIKSGGKKIFLKVFVICMLVFVIYSFFTGSNGFFRIYTLFRQKENLKDESKLLEARMVDLETKKKLLEEEDLFLEKQARERLGMAKEDEVIYKFVDTSEVQENKR
ncbi:MAG: hypothetical protein AMJ90_08795 [candidate division Zixibacteria bacterium SM23_73_2]|nr:MAG: hypothetical protein AMJ90_08795 [candidate division Zixibacteria bacterium SM23_73_2]